MIDDYCKVLLFSLDFFFNFINNIWIEVWNVFCDDM